jgi:hypothetical protein
MDNENFGGEAPAEGVSAETSVPASSPEANEAAPAPDLTKNLKAEMNRKFSKITDQLNQLAQMIQPRTQAPSAENASGYAEDTPEYKRYVDARFQEAQRAEVKAAQETAWHKALETFPELNPDSENFDEKFYKLADKYFTDYDLTRVKDAPLRAAREAALELGKIEQLTKEKLLKDEARRSRIIAEGASAPRDSRKEKDVKINEKGLARLGINPEKLKARLKQDKYRTE